jgi:putative hydrolase of the HAD superfamily
LKEAKAAILAKPATPMPIDGILDCFQERLMRGADFERAGRVLRRPRAILVDFGGTLVEESGIDLRAGNEWLLARATKVPSSVTVDAVVTRAAMVARQVAARRDEYQIEIPWPTLARLVHDFLGIEFGGSTADLELGFWKAAVRTRPMPGARAALDVFRRWNVPVAVLSNTSFNRHVIGYDLARHGLGDALAFIMVSAEYGVRKPNVLLFETAAARLGVPANEVWVVGDRLDTDIAGAKAAGMTAVWLRPTETQGSSSTDLIAADWGDVIRQVERAEATGYSV